ncbi:hypothetical protein DPMN_080067 [Dreissena polymorpha]|uniref:Uncharacterized protein n=1 Tax=Dreissena polymorpha TaxID=45954 RepID=A0A9D4BQN1_DREPO|nr:hypothetical protein DPMN_080067 [Dreissena polymorpha]
MRHQPLYGIANQKMYIHTTPVAMCLKSLQQTVTFKTVMMSLIVFRLLRAAVKIGF